MSDNKWLFPRLGENAYVKDTLCQVSIEQSRVSLSRSVCVVLSNSLILAQTVTIFAFETTICSRSHFLGLLGLEILLLFEIGGFRDDGL